MTTRSKITLRNNFHGTEATVIAFDSIISAHAMRRAENKLCGISDCACGKRRGPQDVHLEPLTQDGAFRIVGEAECYGAR